MKATILMIEDNVELLRTNQAELEEEGYRVLEAETLRKGMEIAERECPDLILLDILLPDGNGLEFCRKFMGSDIRLLFLSALNTKDDVIAGLRAGGDDYLPKPYLMEELLARVGALLRRKEQGEAGRITKGNLSLDTSSQNLRINGNDIPLSQREFSLLLYLIRNEGREFSSDALYKTAWGQSMGVDANAVRVVISRLRKKIKPGGYTITDGRRSGSGYCFRPI